MQNPTECMDELTICIPSSRVTFLQISEDDKDCSNPNLGGPRQTLSLATPEAKSQSLSHRMLSFVSEASGS